MSESDQHDRIRWGRWIGWIAVFLLLAVVITHSIWTSMAASRMNRKIEALRRAGEPVLPMDFAVANLNAADNAGPDILAAAKLIDSKDPKWDAYQRMEDPDLPLRPDERGTLIDASEAIQPALARLEAARGKTRFEWDIDFSQSMVGLIYPSFGEVRQLGNALVVQAIVDHEHQRDRAAVDRLEQMSLVTRLADRHPSLIGHLVANGLDGFSAQWLIRFAPDLRIGTGENDATPEQIRRVIERLMDETSAREALIHSLRGERMFEVDMVKSVVDGVPAANTAGIPGAGLHPAARYALRPLYYRAGGQLIDNMNAVLAAAAEQSLPAANGKLPSFQPSNSLLDAISRMLIPSLNRVIETHYRGMAERQFAAVALAVRWYAVEHNGQLPTTLEELLPRYLPSIPVDRMSASLSPLKYQLGPNGPIVYSVSLNGMDDGGSEAPRYPNPRRAGLPVSEWEMLDRVAPLYRRPRPVPLPDEDSSNPPSPTTTEAATAPAG